VPSPSHMKKEADTVSEMLCSLINTGRNPTNSVILSVTHHRKNPFRFYFAPQSVNSSYTLFHTLYQCLIQALGMYRNKQVTKGRPVLPEDGTSLHAPNHGHFCEELNDRDICKVVATWGYFNLLETLSFFLKLTSFCVTITILDIIHRPVFYLKHNFWRLDSVSVFR
jgi:hypothetical protein